VLARLWKPIGAADPLPKPLPLTVVVNRCAEPLPRTVAQTLGRERRQKRVLKPPSQPSMHARALLAFIQEECPQYIGGYVPRPDLERFYRGDVCRREGWEPYHWTAIARRLGEITEKKSVRDGGDRFVGYRIPSPKPTQPLGDSVAAALS
jgi:hypothetical protein